MKQLFTLVSLCVGFCLTANADVWKWVDAHGNRHFVDTMKPIYTWADEAGNLYFSDTPDHENAVVISPVWHSSETLDSMSSAEDEPDSGADTPRVNQTNNGLSARMLRRITANKRRKYSTLSSMRRSYTGPPRMASVSF